MLFLKKCILMVVYGLFHSQGWFAFDAYNVHRFVENNEPVWNLALSFDQYIPLIPEFIWIYHAYLPLMLIVSLLITDQRSLYRWFFSLFVVNTVAFAGFYFIPSLMQHVALPADCSRLSCAQLSALWLQDKGVNLFPSLHVANMMLVVLVMLFSYRKQSLVTRLVAVGVSVLAGLILISTLFTNQHYFVDLLASLGLSAVVWWLAVRLFGDEINKEVG
jgi:membrane-associated phospholipid phosphatase